MVADIGFISSDSAGGLTFGGNFNGYTPVAQRLLANNMNPGALRTNETLRKDEWEQLDKVVVEVGRERLRGVADLFARGLILPVPNALGTTVVQHETQSEMTQAEVTMDGVTRVTRDRVTFNLISTPLPVIHHDFEIGARTLAASRTTGQPLDTTQTEEATRQVTERIEDLYFNGLANFVFGFGTNSAQLLGLTTHADRNTYSVPLAWTDSAISGELILTDILAMMDLAHADRMFGPYILYVPQNYWVGLMEDFKANSDKTILQRIKELPDIIDVRPADKLTASEILLVQMTRNVVDMAVGIQPTVVQWEIQGGMMLKFKVMAIMVPRPKSDHDNRSGIVHGS